MLVSSPHPRRLLQRAAAVAAAVLLVAGCGLDPHSDGATAVAPDAVTADPALVHTASGTVRGAVNPELRFFGGIPYAAPPLGPLRFRPPAPAAAWDGARDAAKPGARCIQDPKGDLEMGRNTSEDCLTLNVWTPPVRASGERRPVLVWLHGGGFINGSSSIYNSTRLTTRGDVVVVTVNYRLGALGFLAHPALGAGPDVGNYGLADQQAALRWVRDNVAAFGGDPGKVTIAGESAGAMSVCDHLVAPESYGLFRAAIMQSGPCQAQADLRTAERISASYAAQAGCTTPATVGQCLRDLPADRLRGGPSYVRIGTNVLTGPVTGTRRLPAAPPSMAGTGMTARVPVLIGSTADEFTLFVATTYLRRGGLPAYHALLADTFGAEAAAVAAHYPPSRYDGIGPAYAAAVGDGVFACPIEAMSTSLARRQPVYAYEFADRTAPAPEPMRAVPFALGAGHALELRYLFDMGGAPPLNPAQRALADQMVAYWSSFVASGNPDVQGQPSWPRMNPDQPQRLSLQTGEPVPTTDFGHRHQCDFWSSRG